MVAARDHRDGVERRLRARHRADPRRPAGAHRRVRRGRPPALRRRRRALGHRPRRRPARRRVERRPARPRDAAAHASGPHGADRGHARQASGRAGRCRATSSPTAPRRRPTLAATRRWRSPRSTAGAGRTRVRLAIKRAGRAFGAPATVATGLVGVPTSGYGDAGGVTVALGAQGDLVVAYQRERGRRAGAHGRGAHRDGRPEAVAREAAGPAAGLAHARLAHRAERPHRGGVAHAGHRRGGQRGAARARGPPRPRRPRLPSLAGARSGGPAARGLGTIALTLAPDARRRSRGSIRGSSARGSRSPCARPSRRRARRSRRQRSSPERRAGDVVTDGTGAAVAVFTEFESGPRSAGARARGDPAGRRRGVRAGRAGRRPRGGRGGARGDRPAHGPFTAVRGGRALRSSTRG